MSKTSAHRYALAKRKHKKLCNMLGGKCEICGTKEDLTIDHVEGRSWDLKKVASWTRAKIYWREFNTGVKLRVLCYSHNSGLHPGNPEERQQREPGEEG